MVDNVEIWCPVPGYVEWYSVSTLGRVHQHLREVRLKSGKIKIYRDKLLSSKLDVNGYPYVHLLGSLKDGETPTGNRKYWRVHQLVLLAFVGEPPKGMETCHRNGNMTRIKIMLWTQDSMAACAGGIAAALIMEGAD